jgi:serine/threonine protein kinase
MADPVDPEAELARARIGRTLGGKWQLDALLGMGGMAAVYSATSSDGERVAIKVLHTDMSRRPDIRQRFAQEGMAATRVGHAGVVKVLGSGEDPDGSAYIVMELLQGEPLSATVKRAGTLAVPRLVDIMDQVLDVLAAAHAQNIVHRDLKPDNLFVTSGGAIKVLDFGIARVLDDVPGAYKTRTNVTLGTVPFMSPEQALGKRDKVDGRSDLFSLGAMIFRIVAGRHVHPGDSDAEILVAMASRPAPPLSSVAPKASPGLCAIVDLALAFSKDSRYPDARTMQEDVRALAEGRPPPYSTRVLKSKEMSTRVGMSVPVIPPGAGAKETVPEATATTQPAPTRVGAPVDTHAATLPGGMRRDPEAQVPTAQHGVAALAPGVKGGTVPMPASTRLGAGAVGAGSDQAPVTASPESLRAMAMPVFPEAPSLRNQDSPPVSAKTLENPAFTAPTAELSPSRQPGARTLISGGPTPPVDPTVAAGAAGTSVRPVADNKKSKAPIVVAVIALLVGGAAAAGAAAMGLIPGIGGAAPGAAATPPVAPAVAPAPLPAAAAPGATGVVTSPVPPVPVAGEGVAAASNTAAPAAPGAVPTQPSALGAAPAAAAAVAAAASPAPAAVPIAPTPGPAAKAPAADPAAAKAAPAPASPPPPAASPPPPPAAAPAPVAPAAPTPPPAPAPEAPRPPPSLTAAGPAPKAAPPPPPPAAPPADDDKKDRGRRGRKSR